MIVTLQPVKWATWNIYTVHQAQKLTNVASETKRLKLVMLALSRVRWPLAGKVTLNDKIQDLNKNIHVALAWSWDWEWLIVWKATGLFCVRAIIVKLNGWPFNAAIAFAMHRQAAAVMKRSKLSMQMWTRPSYNASLRKLCLSWVGNMLRPAVTNSLTLWCCMVWVKEMNEGISGYIQISRCSQWLEENDYVALLLDVCGHEETQTAAPRTGLISLL